MECENIYFSLYWLIGYIKAVPNTLFYIINTQLSHVFINAVWVRPEGGDISPFQNLLIP